MKVFIPAVKDNNPFFDEIDKYSKTNFHYGNINDDVTDFDAILINWPEQIFKGQEPTEEQIDLLENKLKIWQLKMKIIYVLHNERRHKGMTPNYKRLYNVVLNNTDHFVHLGIFSQTKYTKLYPTASHIYIPHPLYRNFFSQYNKYEARKKLKISVNKKVIIVPGNVRNLDERKLIIEAFKPYRNSNALLIAPNMFKKELNLNFKGRYFLKKFIDIKSILEYFHNDEYHKYYNFNYKFIDFEKYSLLLSAADLIFIPRIDSLNSGNVFLGLTYEKVIVGPAIGNIKEFLDKFQFPTFEPNNKKSITEALRVGMSKTNNELNLCSNELRPFEPKRIAEQWDNFLEDIIKIL